MRGERYFFKNYNIIEKHDNILPKFKGTSQDLSTKKDNQIEASVYRAYALTSLKNDKEINNITIDLTLSDKIEKPKISFYIKNNKDIPIKKGLLPVYLMALNDQLHEEIFKNSKIKLEDSKIDKNIRKIELECEQKDLISILQTLKKTLINCDIDLKHLEEAKKLSIVLFELAKESKTTYPELADIPVETTIEEYKEIINKITLDDLKEYNTLSLKNANTKSRIIMNKNFYSKNADQLSQIINK